jgi:hypothetical protein
MSHEKRRRRPGVHVGRGAATIAAVLLAAAAATAEDWHQWRGPDRTGVTSEPSRWPTGWPAKKSWTANVGRGGTSPIIAEGKVFAMGWQGRGKGRGDDGVFCFAAGDGKVLWKQTYPSSYYGRHATGDKGRYGGPNSTPAYDAKTKYLITLSLDGELRCWDVANGGRNVWRKNFYDEYKVPQRPTAGHGKTGRRDFGFSSAPLIHGGTVIVDVGGRAGLVMGFDIKTGRRLWRSQSTAMPGSNSGPSPIKVGDMECVASLGLTRLVVTRIDKGHEGRTVAETAWNTSFACNIPTPGVLGNKVVLTSAYNVSRTQIFSISPGRAAAGWKTRTHATVASPVLHDGNVYLPEGALNCLDIDSGQKKWSLGRLGNGSCVVTGDGKVLAEGRGSVILVDGDKRKVLSTVKGVPSGWPSIAFGNGIIVCKDDRGTIAALALGPAPSAGADDASDDESGKKSAARGADDELGSVATAPQKGRASDGP